MGRRPAAGPGTPHLVWSTPYAGTRYAFVVDRYCVDEPLAATPFYGLFAQAADPGRLLPVSECTHVYQTDTLLPGYDAGAEQWAGRDSDDLEAGIALIDTGAA